MKILSEITEAEMIATFLKAEIHSLRFGNKIIQQLKADERNRDIIENPDTSSQEENAYRKELLGKYRGYGINQDLFKNFPQDVIWKKVFLNKEELSKVKYINYDYWVQLSGGTRLVSDGAQNILKGIEVFHQHNTNFLEAAQALRQGAVFPEPILVTPDENSDFVILEGHLRLTAYCMAPECIPQELPAIVGYSKDFEKWGLY